MYVYVNVYLFLQDFSAIDSVLNNLVLTGSNLTQPAVAMDLLQMLYTTVQNNMVTIRSRDLQLITEGTAKLTKYVCSRVTVVHREH